MDFPLEQTCCGQMHFNTGYADETIPLVRRFVDVFGDARWWCRRRRRAWAWSATTTLRVAELSGDAGLAA